jgi:pimeloyl-ACP methyl ester carboxylesterase
MSDPIQEGLFLDIHGEGQWVTMLGSDRSNPAVLVLPGAGAGFSVFAPLFEAWQEDFTLVLWDQPGSGWTAAKNGPAETLSYGRLVRDGLAVVEQVLARLGQERLVLFCLSGGSVVGLQMIRARPDLFSAYVAQGQVTNWARMERLSYRMVLERARATGDAEGVAALEEIGPPPWDEVAKDAVRGLRANAPTPAEAAALTPELMALVRSPPAGAAWRPLGLTAPDGQAAGFAAYAQIKPELAAFDAESLGVAFDVPMVFLQGAEDAHTPTAEVAAYAAKLRAPAVHLEVLQDAGHSAIFLADRMLALLREHMLPLISGRRRPSPA